MEIGDPGTVSGDFIRRSAVHPCFNKNEEGGTDEPVVRMNVMAVGHHLIVPTTQRGSDEREEKESMSMRAVA